jgi:hypothetical protein
MITLFVVGYLTYLFVGIVGLGVMLDKHLNDDKTCVSCWHLLFSYVWALLPVTLFFDLRG